MADFKIGQPNPAVWLDSPISGETLGTIPPNIQHAFPASNSNYLDGG
jgi:hypothetical protein